MIHALGVSATTFDPTDPGRLCRGRERWIAPYPLEDDEVEEDLARLVISGAAFKDDAAADAHRGLPHSKLDLAQVIAALFPRKPLLAFMEDGHPADIPEDVESVEMYTGHRAGGRVEELLVRWLKPVSGVREIRSVLGPDPTDPSVLGFVLLESGVAPDDPDLQDALFLLVGMSTLDSPPARFQPAALPKVLSFAKAVLLLHRDKHGPVLGVYSHEPFTYEARLRALADKQSSLYVTFGIPPMLARWDRALFELRDTWDAEANGPFPVPRAPEGQAWQPRRKHRGKRSSDAADVPKAEDSKADNGPVTDELEIDDSLFLEGDAEE